MLEHIKVTREEKKCYVKKNKKRKENSVLPKKSLISRIPQ